MHSQPEISVIIPTYERPENLRRCLEAFRQISFDRTLFEIIVIDDGGSKPLDRLVREFSDALDINLSRRPHGGPAAARNHGLSLAKGEIVAFTDDDCRPGIEWLNEIARTLEDQSDIIIGGRTANALEQNIFSSASQLLVDFLYKYHAENPSTPRFFATNNMACHRDSLRAIGGFDGRFPMAAAEDRDICDRWSSRGGKLKFVPQMLVFHEHFLDLRSFSKQHLNYGRGAYYFHNFRQARKAADNVHLEPLAFYLNLILHARIQSRHNPMLMMSALFLSQLSNAAGYVFESLSKNNKIRVTKTARVVADYAEGASLS